jgi:hypothetical protein
MFPIILVGYSFGYPLDPYVVFSPAGEAASGHEYWVQLIGDGSTGYLQPIRLRFSYRLSC